MISLATFPLRNQELPCGGQARDRRPSDELDVSKSMECDNFFLQCSDIVGWVTGRASVKGGCWFVSGDSLTGALYIL